MTPHRPLLLQLADSADALPWLLYAIEGAPLLLAPPEADLPTALLSLSQLLSSGSLQKGPIILALPASQCFPIALNLSQLDPSVPESLRYFIEEFIPIPAEDLVADIAGVQANRARDLDCLAVAARLEPLTHLIASLEALGLYTQLILPIDLLLSQAILTARHPAPQGRFLIAHTHASHSPQPFVHLFEWTNSRPSRSFRILADPTLLQNLLSQDFWGPARPPLITLQPTPALIHAASQSGFTLDPISLPAPSLIHSAALQTALQSKQGVRPLINLRKDSLADPDHLRGLRKQAYLFAASLILLLVSLCACWSISAVRTSNANTLLHQQQTQTFASLFPGKPIPSGVRSRLESEHRRLKAQSGLQSGKLPQALALDTLIAVLARIPADAPLRITDLRIDSSKILIQGGCKSHPDADLLASTLRSGALLTVDPPQTEVTSQNSVAFSLTAALTQASPTKPTPQSTPQPGPTP